MFDVEHYISRTGDEPKNREVTTRISRFVSGFDRPEERRKENAYILETEVPIVFPRYTPDRATAENNVLLITNMEKNGSRLLMAPGVIALIMFYRSKGDENTAKAVQKELQNYFTGRIKGMYVDGNDLLINRKKVIGITAIQRMDSEMMMIQYILTMKAEHIAGMISEKDFEDRKYTTITGVCDETGLSPDEIRGIVEESVDLILTWRTEDDSD